MPHNLNAHHSTELSPVPRLLALYMACMPCTASTSHAAWDADELAVEGFYKTVMSAKPT
jgi:hypothetical protein